MTRLTRTLQDGTPEATRARAPRDDVVVEATDGCGGYTAVTGPFTSYERTLTSQPGGSVSEVIEYSLAPLVWRVPFGLLYRRALRHPPALGTRPFWAPPETSDAVAATTIGALCTLAVVFGYLGTLLTQTITFAADEFGASKADQGATLAAVRIGVIGALALTAMADRRGRRNVLLGSAAVACMVSALGSVAPDLVTVGISQTVVRGLATAGAVLLTIMAAEEMPAGSRAFAVSLLTMAGALGVGMCLWALPLADLGTNGWRLLYALPLLFLPVVRHVGHHLQESRRFVVTHAQAGMAGHGRRFWLLAGSALLLNLFTAPASQFMNEFLRDERGFSAARISLFTILTNTPGVIGIIVGGRLADTRGRRLVGAVGVAGGVGFTVAMVLSGGWPMWGLSVMGAIVGAATVPALGVYGPELFPTSLRGRANGIIAILGVAGSVMGLLVAGYLSDRWGGLGPALALLAVGPALMAILVLVAYPETAHRELEELNPEDVPGFFDVALPTAGVETADAHPDR
ncbi:MAG: MFS transporter [Acidimicrobiales bacterium]